MPVSIAANLEERLVRILDDQRLTSDELTSTLEMIQRKRQQSLPLSHSLHLNVLRGDNRLHLRVLAFSGKKWKSERLACIRDHTALHRSISRRKVGFRVPRLIEWGETPLLWDLTEYIDGTNLPWRFPGNGRLSHHLDKVEVFARIDSEVGRSRIPDIHERDLHAFARDVERWATWAVRMQIIDRTSAQDARGLVRTFVDTGMERNRIALSHGDYNPSNVMFSDNGKPWLIDFDHLRRSIAPEAMARLATVTYRDRQWSDRVIEFSREEFKGPEWDGFLLAAWWHTLNLWRHYFALWAPVKGLRSLTQLDEAMPGTARQLHLQHKLMQRLCE